MSVIGGYIKWICFRSDWYTINLELHNVSITVIKVLWQTWHYNFNWLHVFLFIISECSHEVVLPLDSDGKNTFQKCLKSVWKEKSIVMVCQRWVYGILFILQRILRELQQFCLFFPHFSLSRMQLALFELFLRLPWGNVGLPWLTGYWTSAKSLTSGSGAGWALWGSSQCYHHPSSPSWKRRISPSTRWRTWEKMK